MLWSCRFIHSWMDVRTGENLLRVIGQRPAALSLRPQQFPHVVAWHWTLFPLWEAEEKLRMRWPCLILFNLKLKPGNLISWLSLETSMEDRITAWLYVIVPLKGWNSSKIWEQPWRIKVLFRNKLKSILKSRNACYHSVQNLLSPTLLTKIIKIKMCKTIILRVVLYGCGTWSLTLREERRLRVFENRVLRRIFGPKRDEVTGEWRKLHNDDHYELLLSPNIICVIKKNGMGGACSMYKREVHTGIWWGNLR